MVRVVKSTKTACVYRTVEQPQLEVFKNTVSKKKITNSMTIVNPKKDTS